MVRKMAWIYTILIGYLAVDLTSQMKGGEYHFGDFTGQEAHEPSEHSSKDTNLPMYYTDSCDFHGSKAIGCDEGHVIQISDVRCLPYNITCSEREKIARLCDGLRSCSNIDLRRQLDYHCNDYPNMKVYTSFRCIPEQAKPFCRTNVCSEDSPDVRCRRDKVFHLLSASCYHGQRECSPDVYMAIYRWCEGQRACSMSLLRTYIPRTVCNTQFIQHENLFMDYICIDKSVVADKCTGEFITQMPRFGILLNPGYPNNPHGLEKGCYWAIYPEDERKVVDVTIHLSYSQEAGGVCDARFLQLQYTVCDTGKQTMEPFCDLGRVNVQIHSCGTVFVIHYPYSAGEQSGNRFLVSYSVHEPGTRIPTYENYTYQCEKPSAALSSAKYTMPYDSPVATTTEDTNLTTQRAILAEDQPINDSSVSGPDIDHTKEKKKKTDSGSDPWRLVTMLRVVVVNIFLGLLIIALIMALAFVCYRYKTYGRQQSRPASKSETATTLDADKQSTEMQLLPGDASDKSPHSQNTLKTETDAIDQDSMDKHNHTPVSTNNYETTIFHFNSPATVNEEETIFYESGSGVSSFLPHPPLRRENNKNNNTESAYSSLDAMEDVQDVTDYTEISESSKLTDTSQLTRQNSNDTCQSVRESLQHLKVSDDEYAVVVKSPEHRNASHSTNGDVNDVHSANANGQCQDGVAREENGLCRIYENNSNVNHKDTCTIKPIAHIHPVPEDVHVRHVTPTTMHVIPEHDCLLHKIPPPPPPAKLPPSHLLHSRWGSPKRHAKNVDWHTQHYV